MTQQIHDYLTVDKHTYLIVGVKGIRYFKPTTYGLRPAVISSACWRGFFCGFQVKTSWLRLDDLYMGHRVKAREDAAASPPPDLFGVVPRWDRKEECWWYRRLDHVVPYSGGLLVADGLLRTGYINMGFHPAFKFTTVRELLFKQGRLVETIDHSGQMQLVREELAALPPDSAYELTSEQQLGWIASTFTLEY